MSYIKEDLQSKETMIAAMEKMNSFGLRLTGSDGQNEFIEWIKDGIKELGFEVSVKDYKFTRWTAKDVTLKVGDEDIKVSSPFPYSGYTPEEGVTGKLVKVGNHPAGFLKAIGNIGVCRVRNLSKISSKIAFDKRKSQPEGLEIEPSYRGPVSTSFVKSLLTFWAAHLSGMKAMVCIWEDMSDAMVQGQYLNFIMHYLKLPIIWVNEREGQKLLAAAKKHEKATLRLVAEIKENCPTQSFHSFVPGTDKDNKEIIIVNTHTDGCNCVEENGPVAMLMMMDYFKKHPTKHSLLFVYSTGHFRLPNFRTGFDQATSRWLADHKPLWNGKQFRAYAGVAVEHLGCTEWKDRDGVYTQTNDIDVELVYTGNKFVDDIYYKAVADRTLLRTMTLRGHNMLHFGEGQPLFNKKIPEIALVTAPDYLCSVDEENHHMDKFNADLMYEQVGTFINCVNLLDNESRATVGKSQFYSLGLGKLK